MTYILNSAKTMRNLRLYAGSFNNGPGVSAIEGSRVATFDAAADLKPGATFYSDSLAWLATVQGGAGTEYVMDQPAPTGATGGPYQNWYASDRTTAKGRNSSGVIGTYVVVPGMLVPDAIHYIYASVLDDAGNPDYYVYVDTIQPERGVHPHTRDVSIGSFKTVPRTLDLNKTTGRLIMRKLPRQVDTPTVDSEGVSGLGRNVSGGTRPRCHGAARCCRSRARRR